MNLFQYLTLPVIGLLFLASMVAVSRKWVTWREGFVLGLVWIATGVAIAWPDLTTDAAKILGIRRGTDLVFYVMFLVVIVGFFLTYRQLSRMQREITLLVRHVAMRDVQEASSNEEE